MKNLLVEMKHGIYPCRIFCAVNCDKAFLEQQFTGSFELDEKTDAACFWCNMKDGDNVCTVIVYPDTESITRSTISHEATHAAMNLFKHISADLDADYSEPFCYLVGAIVEFTDDVFRYATQDGTMRNFSSELYVRHFSKEDSIIKTSKELIEAWEVEETQAHTKM